MANTNIRRLPTKNPVAKSAIVRLNGQDYHVRYSLNALAEIEESLGVDVFSPDGIQSALKSIKSVRFLIYAGLKHEDPELTEEMVGDWIDPQNVNQVMRAINEAMTYSMPEPEEVKSENGTVPDPNFSLPS